MLMVLSLQPPSDPSGQQNEDYLMFRPAGRTWPVQFFVVDLGRLSSNNYRLRYRLRMNRDSRQRRNAPQFQNAPESVFTLHLDSERNRTGREPLVVGFCAQRLVRRVGGCLQFEKSTHLDYSQTRKRRCGFNLDFNVSF